jgi:hypothetical protein
VVCSSDVNLAAGRATHGNNRALLSAKISWALPLLDPEIVTSRSVQFGDANLVLPVCGKVVEAGFLKPGTYF